MTDVIPSPVAKSIESLKGKKASEARTAPLISKFACLAFLTASSAASILLICPAPIPSVLVSSVMTIAFDFTKPTTFHAKRRALISFSVGFLLLTYSHSSSLVSYLSFS